MKKLLMTLVFALATALSLSAKCDWSTLKLQQWNQGNEYKWYVSGKVLDDTCVDYLFMMYDFQTKKVDTLNSFRGLCEVQFNKKGKYKMYLKVWNKCLKCDTALYREVNIIYFPNCKFVYRQKSTKRDGCLDSIVGEMSVGPWTKGDTCWEYYLYMWNGPKLDKISDDDWNWMSDEQLFNYYDFNDSDLVWLEYPGNSARFINYKFPKNGHYLIATQWYNKCVNQDTFFLNRINIKCFTSGTIRISKNDLYFNPNPANEKIQVCHKGPVTLPLQTYTIYDSQGRVVKFGGIRSCIEINTVDFPEGVYSIKIGQSTQRFVIQH
jgi:hypothetical protein